MSHTVDGQTTSHTWDAAAGLPVVLEDNTYTYVYGLDMISATDSGGNQNYYMHNGQGSVANIVDYNGNEKARYLYDAFGNTRYELELTPNVWLYTGEQQDDGTGFYYLRARYYDPFLGRFVSRDPAGAGNGYSYVLNNPVNLVDPYGLFGCKDIFPDDSCEEGKELWEDVENATDGVIEAVCGEEGAVGCAKKAYDYVRDEFDKSNLGEVADFLSQLATNECLGFAAQATLLGIAVVGGPQAALAARITASYVAGLQITGDIVQGNDDSARIRFIADAALWDAFAFGTMKNVPSISTFGKTFGRTFGFTNVVYSATRCGASL